jgi:hypothetical protein
MKFYLLLFAMLILTASHAQEAVFYVHKPDIHFPRIDEGQVIEHTFVIENKGDVPLEIYSYDVECSCTSISFDTQPIPPGKSSSLTLRFDSSGKKGLQDRYILLETNTSKRKEQLHFEVWVRQGK